MLRFAAYTQCCALLHTYIEHTCANARPSPSPPSPLAGLSRAVTTGCSCKPLKVDKLSVAKLREELTRGAGADEFAGLAALGKSELVSALRDKLKDCALCRDNNCICVQEGIECRSDTCECLRHGARGGHKSCENPHGVSVFDSAVVQEYRKMFLSMHDVVPS